MSPLPQFEGVAEVAKPVAKGKVNPATGTRTTGTTKGKSNVLGHGGRAQQLLDKGVPKAVIGQIARRKGAAPGGPNYHGGK